MKQMFLCLVALTLCLTFSSCSHQSCKNLNDDFAEERELGFFDAALNWLQSGESGLNDDAETSYTTVEDENGYLRSVQILYADKCSGVKYANTNEHVSAGDFVMVWKNGFFTYLVKCDKHLSFQERITAARKWCVETLGIQGNKKDYYAYRYPRVMCVK